MKCGMKRISLFVLVFAIFAYCCGCDNSNFELKETTPDTFADVTINADQTENQTNIIDNEVNVSGENDAYEYMDFVGWEYPNNTLIKTYMISTDLVFEEGDVVHIDDVMGFYRLFEMIDNGTHELYEHLKSYRTNPSGKTYLERCQICIPKEIVNDTIKNHFAIEINSTNSRYTHPEQSDCYLLTPSVAGNLSVVMKDYVKEGNRSKATYALFDSIDKSIYSILEICIENENSKDEFRIIYARKIGTGSMSCESND